MHRRQFLAKAALVPAAAMATSVHTFGQADTPVYVTLWFDTEDYILPASDDAALRLAEMLTRLGVKATFKIVGEKARVLETRRRTDVIAALARHEIGYHSNLHSGQPTPAVYLQHAGWEDGVAEFFRRESSGVRDIQRIFGVTPICYGQPGSSWAPQSYAAIRRMGVSMYLDEASHVGIDDQPFYYGGLLNVFKMRSTQVRMDLGRPGNLAAAQAEFRDVVEALRRRGGGTISIYYHPCEFVHREFWDGVNFRRGANPPRGAWKLPATQPTADVERNFRDFEQYVRFIQEQADVQFVHCRDLMALYEDRARRRAFMHDDIVAIARSVEREVSHLQLQDATLSASDAFSLLTRALLSLVDGDAGLLTLMAVDGPASPFVTSLGGGRSDTARLGDLVAAGRDVARFMEANERMPDEVWLGTQNLSPEDYVVTVASVIADWRGWDENAVVSLKAGRFTADRHVAEDSTTLWGWVIFPEGFHAPRIMEQARLQAWTIKPALLARRLPNG